LKDDNITPYGARATCLLECCCENGNLRAYNGALYAVKGKKNKYQNCVPVDCRHEIFNALWNIRPIFCFWHLKSISMYGLS